MPDKQPRDVRKVPKSLPHVNRNLLPASNPAAESEQNRLLQHLLSLARENPYWQFTVGELVVLTNHSAWVLRQINKHPESPFVSGKSRPERINRWLDSHLGWMPDNE